MINVCTIIICIYDILVGATLFFECNEMVLLNLIYCILITNAQTTFTYNTLTKSSYHQTYALRNSLRNAIYFSET